MTGYCKPVHIWLLWIFIVYESAVAVSGTSNSKSNVPTVYRPWYNSYARKIIWSLPYGYDVPIDYFKARVNCTKDDIIRQNTTTKRELSVKYLPTDQCCYVDLSAVNKAGEGPKTRVNINPLSPKIYYKITQQTSTFGKSNVTFRWTTEPYPTHGTIYKFFVKIRGGGHIVSKNLLCRGPDCLSPCDVKVGPSDEEFDQNQNYFTATLPTKPARQYGITIESHVVGGSVGRMRGNHAFLTRAAAPSSPVREVKVKAKNESTITASWLTPTEDNGRIRQYNVSLSYGKQNCLAMTSSDDYYIPETMYLTLPASKDNTYHLTGLKPYTEYNLTVNAINSAGHGLNWSEPLIIRTDPLQVVKGHLRNIKTIVTTRSVKIDWSPACPIDGPVSTYSIEVFNRGQLVSTFETSNTSINLPGLQPDTFYTTQIRGKNSQIQSLVDALTKVEINVCMNKWSTLRDYFLGKLDESRVTIAGQAAILRQKLNETMEDAPSTTSPNSELDQSETQLASLLEMGQDDFLKTLLEPETDVDNKGFFEKLLPSVGKLDSLNTMEFRWEVKILLLKYLECQKTPASKPWI